jgi:hypothetical protein
LLSDNRRRRRVGREIRKKTRMLPMGDAGHDNTFKVRKNCVHRFRCFRCVGWDGVESRSGPCLSSNGTFAQTLTVIYAPISSLATPTTELIVIHATVLPLQHKIHQTRVIKQAHPLRKVTSDLPARASGLRNTRRLLALSVGPTSGTDTIREPIRRPDSLRSRGGRQAAPFRPRRLIARPSAPRPSTSPARRASSGRTSSSAKRSGSGPHYRSPARFHRTSGTAAPAAD